MLFYKKRVAEPHSVRLQTVRKRDIMYGVKLYAMTVLTWAHIKEEKYGKKGNSEK